MCNAVIAARANVEACKAFENEVCAIIKEKHRISADDDGNESCDGHA